jgi:hypothetical protein
VIDENRGDDATRRSERSRTPAGPLTSRVPGVAANAPKRNVLVALGYLFVCVLAAGLLWTAL